MNEKYEARIEKVIDELSQLYLAKKDVAKNYMSAWSRGVRGYIGYILTSQERKEHLRLIVNKTYGLSMPLNSLSYVLQQYIQHIAKGEEKLLEYLIKLAYRKTPLTAQETTSSGRSGRPRRVSILRE